MKKNNMWGILAGCIFCTALFPCTVKANNETQEIMDQLVTETPTWDIGISDSTLKIDQADAVRLMKIAYAEAGTEGIHGQYLVMRVVINRLNSDNFPNSIEEIISQDNQFESYRNGSYQNAKPTFETHIALVELEKNIEPETQVLAFETVSNGDVLTRWFDMYFTYLNHNFYKQKD